MSPVEELLLESDVVLGAPRRLQPPLAEGQFVVERKFHLFVPCHGLQSDLVGRLGDLVAEHR